MQLGLEGRCALVTGSDRGIGKAIALGLAGEGVHVVVHSADDPTRAAQVADEIRACGVQSAAVVLDFTQQDAGRLLFEESHKHLAHFDILVVNASVQINQTWEAITMDAFETQITVNLRATVEIIQAFLPSMIEQGWGRVLALGSVQEVKPHWKTPIYAMTKAAQQNLMHNLAKQFSRHGVTFNTLSPGFTATERTAPSRKDAAYMTTVVESIPARRIAQPEDCTGAALFLCSNAASYVTGVDLYVDGGMHLT